MVEEAGVPEENIFFLCVVAVEEGLRAIHAAYPKIKVLTAALDSHLNDDKYIVPGLGEFIMILTMFFFFSFFTAVNEMRVNYDWLTTPPCKKSQKIKVTLAIGTTRPVID